MSHTTRTPGARLRARVALATALGLTLSGLVLAPATAGPRRPAPPVAPAPITSEYLPGVEADLYLPATRARSVPLVVLIPGGSWQSADRTGLGQLAEALAAKGVAVSNATYRIGSPEAQFPVPAQDIACAVDAAVAAVKAQGLRPRQVVLAGHSAGAHLSSLAAFAPEEFRSDSCPYPRTSADGWVGLSGFYDIAAVEPMAAAMMGGTVAELPEAWAQATTTTHLADSRRRQHLDVLLVQGGADEFGITVEYAQGLGDLMRERRYRTTVVPVPDGDHASTYQAPVVASTILRWLCTVNP